MLLVTGITGHSGSYFLQELIDNNYQGAIRCVVRSNSSITKLDNSGLNIKKAFGDLGDQEFMNECMIGVDTVLHIGSIFYSITVTKAAVKANIKRIILVHTTGVYSKYKSASEEYKNIEGKVKEIIMESGASINVTILRPTMIFGNINDRNMAIFIKMVDKLRVFPVINRGASLLQPVNGRDLGKAYYQVLCRPEKNGDYILSGERPISMLEMLKLISDKLGKKTTFINIPLGLGVLLGRILKAVTIGKVDYIEKVQRMGEDRSFPHEDAARDFGYRPIPFVEGIEKEVRQYVEKFK